MPINVPKVNVGATKGTTARKNIYLKMAPDSTTKVRFLPSGLESGALFLLTQQHWGLKDGEKGIALACLRAHGTEETGNDCAICEAVYHILDNGTEDQQDVMRRRRANRRFFAQVVAADDPSQVKLISLPATLSEKLTETLEMQVNNNQPIFADPEEGQFVALSRKGSGMQSRYDAMMTGVPIPADELLPGWPSKLHNLVEALDLKVYPRDRQIAILQQSVGSDVDLEDIFGDNIA